MKRKLISKAEIKLVGLSVRTNNANEMDADLAKIGGIVGRYGAENIAAKISNRLNPGITLSVYTEYASDEHGDYTYLIGEEVGSFENIPSGLKKLVIPAAKYQRFTTGSGQMPEVVINAWMSIWKMSSEELTADRAYQADFELYDQRAKDPANTSLDIFVGIK